MLPLGTVENEGPTRSQRLRHAATLLAVAGALACGSDPAESAAAPRVDRTLSDGWRFAAGDVAGAEAPGFDDSAEPWSSVGVPHTYNALDGQDGEGDYYRGPAWYRTRLLSIEPRAGQRVYLQFDGANAVADVYVNGVLLGQHRGGFAAFRFDAADALGVGENLLAVRVDNAAVADVPPLNADFTFFGGLYRDVQLLTVSDLHLDLDEFGSSGV